MTAISRVGMDSTVIDFWEKMGTMKAAILLEG